MSSGRSLPRVPLACTVRDCGLPLEKREREYVCEYGHTFDIARSGYVNLLQPQLDHLMGRLANRRRELAEQYPHLASELSRIELDGVNDTTSKWLLKGPRSV